MEPVLCWRTSAESKVQFLPHLQERACTAFDRGSTRDLFPVTHRELVRRAAPMSKRAVLCIGAVPVQVQQETVVSQCRSLHAGSL